MIKRLVQGGPFPSPITMQYSTASCGLNCKLLFYSLLEKAQTTTNIFCKCQSVLLELAIRGRGARQ